MKRIYVFGTRGFPNVQGGVEKHCEHVYPEIARLYDIHVFRRKPFLRENAKKEYKGIHFIDLPSTKIKGFEAFFHSFLCTIYCIVKRPDIVHIHNIGPGMFIPILRLFGLKVILSYHSANYEHKKWGYTAKKILKLSEWIATSWATAIIFVNKGRLSHFKENIRRKSTYIPNGVSVKHPTTETRFLDNLALSPRKYILAVGRITQEKGFDYLIEAYGQSKLESKLVIAGGTDHASAYSDNIYKNAKKYGVIMPGYVDGEFLRELYSHAALFVLPSFNEEFPLVMLEALSYKLPILASDIPANTQMNLAQDDYFKVGDITDLANHLRKKLAQPFSASNYSVKEYTWDSISRQLATIYNNVLEKR